MFYERLSILCLKKRIAVSSLVKSLGLSTSKVTAWKNGTVPKGETLIKIADYFGVSVDYLLGRKESNSVSAEVTNNNGVIGHINAPTTIKSTSLDNTSLSTQEIDLLRIYRQSDGKTQMKIMQFVYDLDNK